MNHDPAIQTSSLSLLPTPDPLDITHDWAPLEIRYDELHELTTDAIEAMFHAEVPGIRIIELYSPEECARALVNLQELNTQFEKYDAIELGMQLGPPSHWVYRYGTKEWGRDYFEEVLEADRRRQAMFDHAQDPVALLEELLRARWPHGPVGRATHPAFGRRLFAGAVRAGAPKMHFDWVPYDLRGMRVANQAGGNLYLRNDGPGGDLRVFQKLGRGAVLDATSRTIMRSSVP